MYGFYMMSRQLFKKPISIYVLTELLDKISKDETKDVTKDVYIIDTITYKKMIYKELLTPFLKELEEYYYNSKKKYISREMTYSRFLTIVRQICAHNKVLYTKKILYIKNSYEIVYSIFP